MFNFFLIALFTTCFFPFKLKLKWLKNGGAKDFTVICNFLRITTLTVQKKLIYLY